MTFAGVIVYLFGMYSGATRLIAILILALSLCGLSGTVTSLLAEEESHGHVSDCCPPERADGQEETDHCVSPECQCLSCLTVGLQQIAVSIAGGAESKLVYHDAATPLTGGDYRTIDYPPETA